MKTFALMIAGLGVAMSAVPASAQGWQNINAREARIEQRINQGIRSGALNRNEAQRLRGEFRGLVRLENRYRAGGLNLRERNDLNRRYDALSAKVRVQKNDRQVRRYR